MPHLSLVLTLALAAGLTVGVLFDLAGTPSASAVMAAGWIVALGAYHRGWPRTQLTALALSTIAAGWLLGAAAVDRALQPPLRVLLEQRLGGFAIDAGRHTRLDEPVVVEGRLRADAAPTETGVSLRIDVARAWPGPCPEPAAGGVAVTVAGALHGDARPTWTAGRVVRAPVLLRRPARYLNWSLPDQERAMARRGIALVGSVKSAALVEVTARGRWWEEAAAAVRAATRDAMARHVTPRDPQAAAIATALLIGDRAAIERDVERRLQQAGTYHVIAISGGNIAILAGLALGVLSWLGIRGRVAALVTIAMLAGYGIVASGGASVARATLMASLYLAVRLIDQRTAAANAIALSGAVLLLVNPLTITDVGFWLTFGATGAIVIGASRMRAPATRWERPAAALLLASVCAELALAPVSAAAFQRVTLAGLALNFVAIPCMTLVQIAAMFLVLVDVAGVAPLARGAATLVQVGTTGLVGSAGLLDVAPWLTWRVPAPGAVVMASYYAALAAWWWGLASPPFDPSTGSGSSRAQSRDDKLRAAPSSVEGPKQPPNEAVRRWVGRASAVTAAALFLWIVVAPAARVRQYGDGRLHLSLIDVGQGDAMAVTFPNGRALTVDAGGVTAKGDFDIGDRVVGPVLRARQRLDLDYVAVTHGDLDHLGGARSLVRDFGPREVWWGVPVAHHEPTALVRAEADRVRAGWRTLQRGDRLEIGGVELRVHHPPPPDWERQRVRNNDSLVMELRFGRVSILLTGDIGREVEQQLLPTLDLLPIVVLKVPHHGSGTSSSWEFVAALKPAIALIGAGRGNFYGHPVPYVLDRYRQAGAEVFRTDQDGQIEVTTDGVALSVRTFTGRWHEITK